MKLLKRNLLAIDFNAATADFQHAATPLKNVYSHATCAFVLAMLWLVLTGGDTSSWLVGIPAILVAMMSAHLLAGSQNHVRISLLGVVRFVPFFLWRCFTAGMDVARRAMSPNLSLEPALIEYHTGLPHGPPRVAFVSAVSLLPGTLSAGVDDDCLTVHLLDRRQDYQRELWQVERSVAWMFGVDLVEPAKRIT